MAIQVINVGSSANSGGGDPLRSAMIKINENFTELYRRTGGEQAQTIIGADSTVLVDGPNSSLNANALSGTVPTDLISFSDLANPPDTIAGFGITDAYTKIQVYTKPEVDTLLDAPRDLQGTVVGDDSTVLIDGVNSTINAAALTGALPAIDGSALTGITATANNLVGDMKGSVYADDSTLLVDGVNGTINSSALTKPIKFNDDEKAIFGTGDDLQIWHNASNSIIQNATGQLQLRGNTIRLLNAATTEDLAIFTTGGSVDLYYNGNKKFETTTDGIAVTGRITGLTNPTAAQDAATKAYVDATSGGGGGGGSAFTNIGVGADDSAIKSIGEGESFLILGGTGITTASDAEGNITITGVAQDFTFASLTGKPTTLSGYGITDGLQLGTSATTALAGDTALFSGAFADLTSKPTTIAGYGITDANTNAVSAVTAADLDMGGNKVLFANVYSNLVDLPSASTYHGMFAHVHATGLAYFAHGGAWIPLASAATTLAGYGITDALASGGALTGSSLDTNTIQTSSGNLAISADNYVQINSDNDGQIEIGTASGLGNVLIGNESNGTQISIQGEVFIEERARFFKGAEEKFATLTGSTGVTAMDCANGHVHYLTGASGDITANFTNLGLTAEYATNLTVIINQGATPYEVTAVQIAGAAQTINWQGGSAPTGNANGIDSFSFTILNDGGTYVVLGQMVDFT